MLNLVWCIGPNGDIMVDDFKQSLNLRSCTGVSKNDAFIEA